MGFSIGATIAWICGTSGICDDIICYYGSPIRDYLSLVPKCRALVLFARKEKSFEAEIAARRFEAESHITISILNGHHGFCDPFSYKFDPAAAKTAKELTSKFLMD